MRSQHFFFMRGVLIIKAGTGSDRRNHKISFGK